MAGPSRRAASRTARSGALEDTPGLSAGAWQIRPLPRGYVEAKSNQPGEARAINPRYLSEKTDRSAIVGGLRLVRIFAAPALQKFVREESLPGMQVQSDGELLDYARRNGGSGLAAAPAGISFQASALPFELTLDTCMIYGYPADHAG